MRKTKWLYGAAFALALAVPLYAWAASENGGRASPAPSPSAAPSSTDSPATKAKPDPGAGGHGKRFFDHHKFGRGFGMMHDGVHEQTYLTLLSEKYAPDLVQQWKNVFDERNALIEQLKSLAPQDRSVKHLPIQKWKSNSGAPATPPADQKDRFKETYQKFTDAVRSGDAAAIREALKQLLDQYKAKNDGLRQKLEALRQSASPSPSPTPTPSTASPTASTSFSAEPTTQA